MSSSDGDDKTGVFKADRTRVVLKKLQVQMPSGKIYGPYSRFEIFTFIQKKKIRGEEKILVEGETVWRPIASDTEFFDAIHDVLSGKSIDLKSKKQEESIFSDSNDKTKVSRSGTQTEAFSAGENTEFLERTRITQSPRKAYQSKPEEAEAPQVSTKAPNVSAPANPKPEQQDEAPTPPKKSPSLLLLLIVVGVIAAIFFVDSPNKRERVQPKAGDSSLAALEIRSAPNYTRMLRTQLAGLKLRSLDLAPGVKAGGSTVVDDVPEFVLNGVKLVARVRESLKHVGTDESGYANFWIQLSSDLQLLGIRIQVVDLELGRQVEQVGVKLQKQLDEKQLIGAESKILIDAYRAHSLGDWGKVETLSRQSSSATLKWILEDAIWWASWSESIEQPLPAPTYLKRGAELDISTRVRQAYRAKDSSVLVWLQQLAKTEATSPLLWLTSAELSWRSSANVQVQSTYRDFTVGIGSLVLYPPSIQLAYWAEFARFLERFARAETHARALKNIELLTKGGIGSLKPGQWWHLDDPGLLARDIADGILDKSRKEILSDRDRAALFVLGNALSPGNDYLFIVGQHYCLQEKWPQAETLFRQMIALDPKDENGYFGLIWSLAEQFRFAEAEDSFDLMASRTTDARNYLRTEGMLHFLARDYVEAHRLLSEAIDRNPNDVWAYYFKAQTYEVKKEFFECVKTGNLARLRAKSELKIFVEILLAKCQVYGAIGIQKALQNLLVLSKENPQNINLRVLIVDLFFYAGLPGEALKQVNIGLEKFPYSPEIHIAAGDLLFKRANYRESLEYYTAAARLDSTSADGWIRIAKVMEEEERFLLAAQNYVAAARAQPDYPEIYLFAARSFDRAGKVDEAAKYYGLEIEYRPESITPFVEAAEFLLRNNSPQKIPDLYQQFKGGYENDPRALILLAQAYSVMGDISAAKSYASRAAAQAPNDPQMNYKLAVILEGAGDYGLAKRYYLKYLELSPAASGEESLREKIGRPPFSN